MPPPPPPPPSPTDPEAEAGTPAFGRQADDYVRHRAGFPPAFFNAIREHELIPAQATVVDLGTGTGTIARGIAGASWAVDPTVIGVDPDRAMLEGARSMARDEGLDIEFCVGTAEVTGLDDDSADILFAGQCWHWFDGLAAAREIRRVLKPGGVVVVAHFDWLPLDGNVCAMSEALIEQHSPTWSWSGGTGIHPDCLTHLGNAGFMNLETFSTDPPVSYSHEAWRGRLRACAGIVILEPDEVLAFDEAHRVALSDRFPDPMDVPHRLWVAIGHAPE